MLDVARRRGAERGVLNVDYRLLDLERIELGDDTVDGVLCRYAYMLVADPADRVRGDAARAAPRRARRARGVGRPTERNPFFAALGMSLVRAGHVPPPDPTATRAVQPRPTRSACAACSRAPSFADVRTPRRWTKR